MQCARAGFGQVHTKLSKTEQTKRKQYREKINRNQSEPTVHTHTRAHIKAKRRHLLDVAMSCPVHIQQAAAVNTPTWRFKKIQEEY